MIEILTVLDNYEDYSKYCDIVKRHNTDRELLRVIECIDRFYKETGETSIDWTSFDTYFFTKNPMITGTKKDIYQTMFDKLSATTGSAVAGALVDTLLQRYHAERIAFFAMEVAEGKKDNLEDVLIEVDTYLDTSGKAALIGEEACTDDLKTILTDISHGKGLRWRNGKLNDSLGPIRKGNFVLFGGRPDSGKTTLLCSEASYMSPQLEEEQQVVYFTNEEGGKAVKLRMMQALLGVDLTTLESDPTRYWDMYVDKLGGNPDKILIVDKHDLSVTDMEWWLKHTNPGLIIIDQLRKVKGFNDVKGVNRLEKLFNYARELSKKYAPIITVTQLDANAENEQYPDMSMLYESKTAVQGEMDAIVNIGRVNGSVPPNARYFNVVKNKLPTPDDPAMRNGRHEVSLQADIARMI